MFEILIDTGGTFTDGVLIDEEQKISTAKFLTDPVDPSKSIMGCISLLAREYKQTEQELLGNTSTIVVGTTLAENCILEGKGAKCCLLHTKGFKDMLQLRRRVPKADIYNLKVPAPPILIPRYLNFGVEERIQHDGVIITPLNEDDVHKAVKSAKEQNVEVPVVCFLHSYINPTHEERAVEIIKADYPNVVASSHILRRWGEWDRASTAAIAGYIKPVTSRFVGTLRERMKNANFSGTLLLLTCAGGVAAPELCLDNPALLVESGPAAAPLAAHFLAELTNIENVLVCDMGGTTFKVTMLPERMISTTTEHLIGEYRSACEGVEVVSIGAGGGSIAWVDERGMLRVGPNSAGADPGPACYSRGGQMPTVTDADVVLGYIPTDYFLGGTMQLEAGLAQKAIEEKVANPLGMSSIEAAHAIATVVETNMSERIFLTAVAKGLDPRDFTLFVGGGAAPVHAAALARRLGMKHVYVPKHSPVLCAFGMATADYKYLLSRFLLREEDKIDADELQDYYHSLEEEGFAILTRQGIAKKDMKFIRGAEMRYFGQLHDIEVLLPEVSRDKPFTKEDFKALVEGFHNKHQAMFDWSNPAFLVTIVTLKLQVIGVRRPLKLIKQPFFGKDPSAALKRKRQVYFKELGRLGETPCYDGDQLRHGNVINGPAIIEETKTTVVVPQGTELTVDAYQNYVLEVKQ